EPTCTILILSPFSSITTQLHTSLNDEGLDVNNCFSEKVDIDTLERIWWMNAIFTDSINPFIVMLLRRVQGAKRDGARTLIRSIIDKGLSREEIVRQIVA